MGQVIIWKISLRCISFFSESRPKLWGFTHPIKFGVGSKICLPYCSQLKFSKVVYAQCVLVIAAIPPNQCHCVSSGSEPAWWSRGFLTLAQYQCNSLSCAIPSSKVGTRNSPFCALESTEWNPFFSTNPTEERSFQENKVKQKLKQQPCPFYPVANYFYPNADYIYYIWTLESSSGPQKALEKYFISCTSILLASSGTFFLFKCWARNGGEQQLVERHVGSKVLWSLGRGKKHFRAKEPVGRGSRKVVEGRG